MATSGPTKKSGAPVGDHKLVAKLVEIEHAGQQLDLSLGGLRAWSSVRNAGEDPGLRLLDCALWAQNLAWLLTQAQIIAKGEAQ